MPFQLSHGSLLLCSTLAAVGCSQIVGISDYEIDPKLNGAAGGEVAAGGDGSGNTAAGGTKNVAGSSNGGQPASDGGAPDPGGAGSPMGGQAGAAPGTVVPCDSADCCSALGGTPVGVELLKDGGFELGPVGDGDSPWTQETTKDFEVITLTDLDGMGLGFKSHAGDYYAYLSGFRGETSTIYSPNFTVPEDAGWMTLSGYRLFQVDAEDATNEDFCGIALYDPAETDPVELPFFWGNPVTGHPDGWGDSPAWRRFESSWDATAHRGAKRYMGFRGSSDEYSADVDPNSSSYLLDDLSLMLFRCYK